MPRKGSDPEQRALYENLDLKARIKVVEHENKRLKELLVKEGRYRDGATGLIKKASGRKVKKPAKETAIKEGRAATVLDLSVFQHEKQPGSAVIQRPRAPRP